MNITGFKRRIRKMKFQREEVEKKRDTYLRGNTSRNTPNLKGIIQSKRGIKKR
jgi:hypothetical protein